MISKMIKISKAVVVFFLLNLMSVSVFAQIEEDGKTLQICHSKNLKLSFLCDLKWSYRRSSSEIDVLIDAEAPVSFHIEQSESPVNFIDEMSDDIIFMKTDFDRIDEQTFEMIDSKNVMRIAGTPLGKENTKLIEYLCIHDRQLYQFDFEIPMIDPENEFISLVIKIKNSIVFD